MFESEFIKWFDTQTFSKKYITDHQLDDIESFSDSKLLIIIGHNEYCSKPAIINIQSFVNNGNNLLVLSGNTAWWQIRYSDDNTKLICYKNKEKDPITDVTLKTINFPLSWIYIVYLV